MYFYIVDSTSKDEGLLNSRRNKFEQLISRASIAGPVHYATGDSDFNLLIDMAIGENRKTLVVIGDDNTYAKVTSALVKLKNPPALGFLPLTRRSFFAQRLYDGLYSDYDLLPILGRRSVSSANCLFVNRQACFDTTTVTNPASTNRESQATITSDSFSINVSKFTTIRFKNPFLDSAALVEVAIESSGIEPGLSWKNSDPRNVLSKGFLTPKPISRVFLDKAGLSMSSPCQIRIDAGTTFMSKGLKFRLSKKSLSVITANKDK